MKLGKSSLNDIAKIRPDSIKRRRISCYDRKGGNRDQLIIKPGETAILGEKDGARCLTHILCTCTSNAKHNLRNAILRMFWDGETEDTPSVEAPKRVFFAMGYAKRKNSLYRFLHDARGDFIFYSNEI